MATTEQIEGRISSEVMGELAIAGTGGSVQVPAFQSMRDVLEFSKVMATGGIAVRKHLRNNPGACAAIVMQAARLGMDPYVVGNKSYEVNDQLAYESQLIIAIINSRAPIKGRFKTRFEGEGAARRCIASATFIGDSEPTEVASPPIAQIKPKNSPLWITDPDQQLAYYTKRLWARRECPEVILGIYDPDEVRETIDITPTDAPPRPTRESIAPPPEEPRLIFVDQEGEEHHTVGARAYADAYLKAIADAANVEILQGLWESNLETLIGLPPAYQGEIRDAYDRTYEAMGYRAAPQPAAEEVPFPAPAAQAEAPKAPVAPPQAPQTASPHKTAAAVREEADFRPAEEGAARAAPAARAEAPKAAAAPPPAQQTASQRDREAERESEALESDRRKTEEGAARAAVAAREPTISPIPRPQLPPEAQATLPAAALDLYEALFQGLTDQLTPGQLKEYTALNQKDLLRLRDLDKALYQRFDAAYKRREGQLASRR